MHAVYILETGLFTGQFLGGDADFVQANVPAGCGVVDADVDWESQRVDLATGLVVDWQPPKPDDDAQQTWAWQPGLRRWVPTPTLAALAGARIAVVQVAIEAAEADQGRPLRELMLSTAAGQPAPAGAAERVARIEARIAMLRGVRAAMAAAPNEEALAAIVWA